MSDQSHAGLVALDLRKDDVFGPDVAANLLEVPEGTRPAKRGRVADDVEPFDPAWSSQPRNGCVSNPAGEPVERVLSGFVVERHDGDANGRGTGREGIPGAGQPGSQQERPYGEPQRRSTDRRGCRGGSIASSTRLTGCSACTGAMKR